MKSLITFGLIAGCAAASSTPISAGTDQRINSSFSSLKKKLSRNEESCPQFSFDLLFLVDGTAEAAELGEHFSETGYIRDIYLTVLDRFPGSRFAFSFFRDKPFEPVGASSDTCFSLATDFTDSEDDLVASVRGHKFIGGTSPGGGDEKFSAQGQAILSAVQYSGLNWRESALARPYSDPARTNVIKQIVLVSYTKSHNPGDGLTTVPKLPSMIDNTYNGHGNPEDLCRQQDYPNISKVILDAANNDYLTFTGVVPFLRDRAVYAYWESLAADVNPSFVDYPRYFKLFPIVNYGWSYILGSLVDALTVTASQTCEQLIGTTSTPPPTPTTEGSTYTWIWSTGRPPTTSSSASGTTTATTSTSTTTTTFIPGTPPHTRVITTRGDRTDPPTTPSTRASGTTTATTPATSTTATTRATSTSSTSTSTAVHNGTGHGCCDGIEFKAQGRIEEVNMKFKWSQRVRRLLSAIAW